MDLGFVIVGCVALLIICGIGLWRVSEEATRKNNQWIQECVLKAVATGPLFPNDLSGAIREAVPASNIPEDSAYSALQILLKEEMVSRITAGPYHSIRYELTDKGRQELDRIMAKDQNVQRASCS